ncbi:hypothetical protein DSCO28_06450 [Desulfosarcina ovata subsp. sediminis]|uniref:Pilus assembly protein PilM n=1 Tax=Desulfosarcina ovata subsp. sediminis TaxID=885957 RepID=A0A5K7ZKA6_9BACT|nr:pilus assembly protein PilM [Desulfosarcina ovata]BBO80079.1 hypothetical protein DSCO28_06450 [Desulfosarcina ovata subsp. sediminis]
MAKKDEISSTEKLLALIRDKDNGQTISCANPIEPAATVQQPFFFRGLSFNKPVGIGIEIGVDHIRIAKISRISDKSFKLLDAAQEPIDPDDSDDTARLVGKLSSLLSRFCGGLKRYDIWCCVRSTRVDTRSIRIPKLPKKQIANAVFWTFSKEDPFNEKELTLDFRILGDINENGMIKTQVMAYTIPIAETETLKRLFQRAGYPLTGITIVPFTIQNLLRTGIVHASHADTCGLFIGWNWSRITIYANGNLILSRSIKSGMHSMIDAIAEHYRRSDSKPDEPQDDKKNDGFDATETETDRYHTMARNHFDRFLKTNPPKAGGGPHGNDQTPDLLSIFSPALERMVKQLERTIAHYGMHFKRPGVDKIFVSGKVAVHPKIVKYFASQLAVPVTLLDPFPTAHPFTRQADIPDDPAVREGFIPAIGAGLSSNELTPNFLFTHRHRQRQDRARQFRIAISAASLGVLLFLLGVFIWQEETIAVRTNEIEKLTAKLNTLSLPLTQNLVMALYGRVNQNRHQIRRLGQRYYPSAILSEISQLTPANIQLEAIRASLGADPSPSKTKTDHQHLVIDGVITGDPLQFDTVLATYMLIMEASPLFDRPVVKNKRRQSVKNQQVLRFSIQFVLA